MGKNKQLKSIETFTRHKHVKTGNVYIVVGKVIDTTNDAGDVRKVLYLKEDEAIKLIDRIKESEHFCSNADAALARYVFEDIPFFARKEIEFEQKFEPLI